MSKISKAALLGCLIVCALSVPLVATYAEGTYGPIKPRDTLSRITRNNYKNSDFSRNQIMVAVLLANPNAFHKGNINMLNLGEMLVLPDDRFISTVSEEEAQRTLKQHNEHLRNGLKGDLNAPRPITPSPRVTSREDDTPLSMESDIGVSEDDAARLIGGVSQQNSRDTQDTRDTQDANESISASTDSDNKTNTNTNTEAITETAPIVSDVAVNTPVSPEIGKEIIENKKEILNYQAVKEEQLTSKQQELVKLLESEKQAKDVALKTLENKISHLEQMLQEKKAQETDTTTDTNSNEQVFVKPDDKAEQSSAASIPNSSDISSNQPEPVESSDTDATTASDDDLEGLDPNEVGSESDVGLVVEGFQPEETADVDNNVATEAEEADDSGVEATNQSTEKTVETGVDNQSATETTAKKPSFDLSGKIDDILKNFNLSDYKDWLKYAWLLFLIPFMAMFFIRRKNKKIEDDRLVNQILAGQTPADVSFKDEVRISDQDAVIIDETIPDKRYHEADLKLEMAAAYIEMGNQAEAESVLYEVLQEGSQVHRQKAERLLRRLS